MVLIDLVGKRFGKTVVICKDNEKRGKQILWVCKCDCGKVHVTPGSNLRGGHTKSCGCLKNENPATVTHGHCIGGNFSGAYKTWAKMRYRVLDPKCGSYKDYGGKGITIDPAWDSFETFFKDMGPRPPGCSIERIDRDGNYEKSNCKWADKFEQANNKSNNVMVEWEGQLKPLSVWAAIKGIDRSILYQRIHVHGWSISKAMSQPVRRSSR